MSGFISGMDNVTLLYIIALQALVIFMLLAYEIWRIFRNKGKGTIWRPFWRIKLIVYLDKDRVLNPQLLTLTIKNTGKREVEINAPVLEFRKIWSKRKFKLSGTNGNYIYPLFIEPGNKHQLFIETARFHQYDSEIKGFYWARIYLSDVEGRRWKSNDVKLRKSWVT
jgi:hypothetical protein